MIHRFTHPDAVMLIATVFLVLTIDFYACHGSAEASELYFRLLQTDGHLPDPNRHHDSQRPSPSDDLPIDDLIEDKNVIYDPRPTDINVKLLRKQLGKAYDREFMSIKDPTGRPNKSPHISFFRGRPKGRRPSFLRLLRGARLQDGRKIRLNVNKKERRKVQKYMWSLTFCPVKYSWKHLGKRFWPQWIKEGKCTSKRSCSIPEGMKCKPKKSTTKTFLRWHCADFKGRNSCKWIHIQYPIITECACSC